MENFPVEKLSTKRMLKYKLYQLLTGQLVTRRDILTAAAAGTTGIALDRFFAMTGGKSSAGAGAGAGSAAWPEPVVVNAQKIQGEFNQLGNYIYLAPEKLGGGTHAVDFATGKTLAWIAYWNYGDSCPISHHLAAYPSPDPYKGFEFVNSTQGGSNVMIYGLPTTIQERGLLEKWGQGNHIYRVQYDGSQMVLKEDISATTGIGLGVHITIFPDAKGFAAADGQKDIAAFFNRAGDDEKTQVQTAFRADWISAQKDGPLDENWSKGGTLRISRLTKAAETNRYAYEGSVGNKIDWEMVPMAENLVSTGQIPGADPKSLTGLDAVVHHPNNTYSALIIRMLSTAVI